MHVRQSKSAPSSDIAKNSGCARIEFSTIRSALSKKCTSCEHVEQRSPVRSHATMVVAENEANYGL